MTTPVAAVRLRHHTPKSYQTLVLEDSPIALWRCGESAGASTLADSSGNSRTATINGTITTGVASNQRLANAADFASGSGYLTVADSSPFRITGNVSVECWMKLAAALTSGAQIIPITVAASGETAATNALIQFFLDFVNSTTYSWTFFHESGSGVDNTATTNFALALLPAGQFNHCVFRRDVTANTYEFFINGRIVGSPVSYTNDPSSGTSAALSINRTAGGTVSNRAVIYDEIAVYSAKLSDVRIFEHYRAGRRT